MSDIHAKTGQLMNKGSAQQIGGSVGGAYDNTVAVKVYVIYKLGLKIFMLGILAAKLLAL